MSAPEKRPSFGGWVAENRGGDWSGCPAGSVVRAASWVEQMLATDPARADRLLAHLQEESDAYALAVGLPVSVLAIEEREMGEAASGRLAHRVLGAEE